MARLRCVAKQSGITTGTSVKTLLQLIAPANQRIAILRAEIGFASIAATDPPVLVELVKQTSAGTMTSHTASLIKLNARRNEAIQTTSQHTATGTEPTTTDVLDDWRVHPQSGLLIPEEYLKDIINGGDRLGLRVTTWTSQSAEVGIHFEE